MSSRRPNGLRGRELVEWYRDNRARITTGGCWVYLGCLRGGGVAQVKVGRQDVQLRRLAYETMVEPVGDRKVESTCGERRCFNPQHARVGRQRSNQAAAETLADVAADILEYWVEPDPGTGCLIYTGRLKQGYGTVRVGGGRMMTHRVVEEAAHGPIPDGVELHHRCHNRACVNVAHLERLTRAEHAAVHRKTHCKRGHELTDDNRTDRRHCRACNRHRGWAGNAAKRLGITGRGRLDWVHVVEDLLA